MDACLATKYAANVTCFISVAAKLLAALTSGTASHHREELTAALVEHTDLTKYSAAENVDLVSDIDSLLLQTASSCQELSTQLLRHAERSEGVDGSVVSDGDLQILRDWLDRLRKDVNKTFAGKLWIVVSHNIGELGAKNRRFAANRTQEIEDISSSLDSCFRQIKASTYYDDQTSEIWSDVHTIAEKIVDLETEQHVLAALQFRSMDRRKDLIAREHTNTFRWILDTDASQGSSQSAPSFVEWLVSDDQLYWISGKPGSGKSTLMKFVASNPDVISKLHTWAKDDTLVTAAFYFWSSAKDPLQKSDAGLLRAILFQILSQCPDLIPHAFPETWEKRPLSGLALRQFLNTEQTAAESLAVFQQMSAQLSATKTKFCFFLDGLDEYDGDPNGLVKLIQSLVKTPNIKVCVSSRPWSEFEEAFGKDETRKLYVHEFTKSDMRIYVNDLLCANRVLEQLSDTEDDKNVDGLVTTLVNNADGVFLSVLLVVRDILKGADNTKTNVSYLQKRLTSIPTNLDEYFTQVFQDTKADMRQKTAQVFRITLDAVERLPLMCYWFIQNSSLDEINQTEQLPLDRATAEHRLEVMSQWLDEHSHGLLTSGYEGLSNDDPAQTELHQWLFGFRVDFLHRTVADFLRTGNMERLLEKWLADSANIDVEICRASLATVVLTPSTSSMFDDVSRVPLVLHIFMSHVKLIEINVQTELLDGMLSAMEQHSDSVSLLPMLILGPGNYWSSDCSFTFAMLYHCVSYDLGEYVERHLDQDPSPFPEPVGALMVGCFSWDPRIRMGGFTLPIHTAGLLMRRGLNINTPWGDRMYSYWQQLVTSTYSRHLKGLVTQTDCDAVEMAIAAGADLDAPIEVFGSRAAKGTTAVGIVEKFLPKRQFAAVANGRVEVQT